MTATRIAPKFVPKVWGSTHLEPWFPNPSERIGEVWFPAGDLLIKFLFTMENLSVQVHPNDEYAAKHENSLGKTEMWHILRAEPGAKVALGFRSELDRERLRELSESGDLTEYLDWHDAKPGDTFFTPAGTVHAIGAGLALCEIQQNSDVTYRIFDYGRPRELHLDRAMDVSHLGGHEGAAEPRWIEDGRHVLVESDHFVTEKLESNQPMELPRAGYAVILDGKGRIAGTPFHPGTDWRVDEACVVVEPEGKVALLVTGSA